MGQPVGMGCDGTAAVVNQHAAVAVVVVVVVVAAALWTGTAVADVDVAVDVDVDMGRKGTDETRAEDSVDPRMNKIFLEFDLNSLQLEILPHHHHLNLDFSKNSVPFPTALIL